MKLLCGLSFCRSPSQSCYRSDRKRRRGVSCSVLSVFYRASHIWRTILIWHILCLSVCLSVHCSAGVTSKRLYIGLPSDFSHHLILPSF